MRKKSDNSKNKDKARVVLVLDISKGYRRGLLRSITDYFNLQDLWDIHFEPTLPASKLLDLAKSWNADGLIVDACRPHGMGDTVSKTSINYIKDLEKISRSLNIPVITLVSPMRSYKRLSYVLADNIGIGKVAAEYFLEKGFKSYAFCGYKRITWSQGRCIGYCETLKKIGFDVSIHEQSHIQTPKQRKENGAQITAWLRDLVYPVAVFACNDECACDVIEVCRLNLLEVPEQVAVLGVDDDEIKCRVFNPPLSSITLNTERAGRQVAELLEKMVFHKKTESNKIIVQPKYVVERSSTNILQIEDKDVADAVRYIRQHSDKILQVYDVLKSVPVSRRTLELKFSQTLGHSINDEIRKCHAKHIARMLIETDMPILNIARSIGYTTESNMSRFFHKTMNCTPRQYRKKLGRK